MEIAKKIFDNFGVKKQAQGAEILKRGRINKTFVITCEDGSKYLLQKINSDVFSDVPALMKNILKVLEHLEARVNKTEKFFQVPVLLKTDGGSFLHQEADGSFWRCFTFLENCQSFDVCPNEEIAREAGLLLGLFHSALLDLNPADLVDTIPDFHFFPGRIEQLKRSIEINFSGRAAQAETEILFILSRQDQYSVIARELLAGKIPLRSVHNDVKLNNFLFTEGPSPRGVSLVDLDTCMGGSALFDFGELIKFIAMPTGEEEADLHTHDLNLDHIDATVTGYAQYAESFLEKREVELLHLSPGLFSLMLASRFLTDYLQGDKYFPADFEGQNLQRCRLQLQLHSKLEHIESQLADIVSKRFSVSHF